MPPRVTNRVDPFSRARPKAREFTRTFIEPASEDGEEVSITLTLRRLRTSEQYQAIADAEPLVAAYVTGDEETGEQAAPFVFADEVIPVTAKLVQSAMVIARMQVEKEGSDMYKPSDWIGFSDTLPTIWRGVNTFVGRIMNGEASQAKNG